MVIQYKNRKDLDKLYIHDSYFTGFHYNYCERKITFSCDNVFLLKKFDFVFHNVIFCSFQSCAFWGEGNHILYITPREKSTVLETLQAKQAKDPKLYTPSALDQKVRFFESVISLNSGDELSIISDAIEWHTENLTPAKNPFETKDVI